MYMTDHFLILFYIILVDYQILKQSQLEIPEFFNEISICSNQAFDSIIEQLIRISILRLGIHYCLVNIMVGIDQRIEYYDNFFLLLTNTNQ
ncbi:hypothetical protein pb186bvf_007267 [Paramecium bursaria]